MWKPLTLALVASFPILPLACQSSDKNESNGNGGGGSGTAGAAVGGMGGSSSSGAGDKAMVGGEGGLATDDGGGDAQGGDIGIGGAETGAAGAAGGLEPTCGGVGEACCAAATNTCSAGLACLAGATCSCVKAIAGGYILRVDGAILEAAGQTPILDAQTGFAATQMEALTDGTHHGCAVKAGGSVWCWRKDDAGNIDGQIGNGAKGDSGAAYRATRVLVSANTPLASASGLATWAYDYWSHTDASCAITSAGKLYCWGSLTWLVNNGTPLSSPYAQAITSDGLTPLTGVVQATAGDGRSACAVIQTAGSSTEVHCWGQNDSYNLGQGDTIKRQYPTKVVGLANPTKVVIAADGNGSGPTTTCALDGGQVRCWGYNASGTCGVNAAAGSITAPTLVKLQSGTVLDQIIDLRATGDQDGYGNGGSATVCALRSDQTIWCWGKHYNAYASNYGVTNVVALGSTWVTPRYVTSDGVYHIGSQQAQTVNCGSLR